MQKREIKILTGWMLLILGQTMVLIGTNKIDATDMLSFWLIVNINP